jgi:hypothetical protein
MREIAASLPKDLREKRSSTVMQTGTNVQPVEVLREDNNVLSLSSRTPRALIYAKLFDDEVEKDHPSRVVAVRTG